MGFVVSLLFQGRYFHARTMPSDPFIGTAIGVKRRCAEGIPHGSAFGVAFSASVLRALTEALRRTA